MIEAERRDELHFDIPEATYVRPEEMKPIVDVMSRREPVWTITTLGDQA